ncbi:sensor histidine kinase [Pontibacter sp. SGAir0037]|uniref:sensor histidine kinase n=1 Tax=Pontibacter sp. SGAir0037 TaxID=2571030 RepID=UPI0010CD5407|nr:sensor histidine kinase [Pontibacter sp. SGAir0037]QCR22517.1 hypothetical protein C1N53_09335 [Pontibacter sp. SGAir0037]
MNRFQRTAVVSHAVGWLLLLSLPLLFLMQQPDNQSAWQLLGYPAYWIFSLSFILLFYLHTYWLIPQQYEKKKYVLYAATLALLFAGISYLRPYDRIIWHNQEMRPNGVGRNAMPQPSEFRRPDRPGMPLPPPDPGRFGRRGMPGRPFDLVSVFLFFTLLALGTTIRSTERLRKTEKRALQAETEKANAELSFLKAQINPHFLFNTLNNIYSLAVTQNEHTPDAILKLSNIMRYVTDDVTEDMVPVEKEAACIRDFIDLQRLRLNKQVQVEFSMQGDLRGKYLPPMVLMTFVENVFKYGVSNHEPASIIIRLVSEANTIFFYCRNKLFEVPRHVVSTGIGIANTKQRLQHLYPDRHLLSIKQEDGFFTVELTIQL